MKEKERDILAERPELKHMPYSIPEGYFDSFKIQMRPPAKTHPAWKRTISYISVAASFALLFTGGFFLLQHASQKNELTQEDFLVFSSSIENTEYYMHQLADAEIADDDIIDYLIYSGVKAEEIEHLNK